MSMVCPQCCGQFTQRLQCPTCGVRLLTKSASRTAIPSPLLPSSQSEAWQHTAVGRLLIGLVLAQGLAYVLRTLCHAGFLAAGADAEAFWKTLTGLVLLQAMQGVGLLVGGALAGAGQPRGVLLGGAVGLVNGFVSIIVQQLTGDPVTEVLFYSQPVLHLAFGMLGGLAGTLIWKPLPTLALASPPGQKQAQRPAPPHPVLSAPVSWIRVFLGTIIVLVGVFWPKPILEIILSASQGQMSLSSQMQAELVTWEVAGLIVLLGAAAAGVNAVSGLKQGLCVGLISGLFFLTIRLGTGSLPALEQTVLTLLGIVLLSLLGGWFGGRLFPPVVPYSHKGLSRISI
jgi:hypothetical protein